MTSLHPYHDAHERSTETKKEDARKTAGKCRGLVDIYILERSMKGKMPNEAGYVGFAEHHHDEVSTV